MDLSPLSLSFLPTSLKQDLAPSEGPDEMSTFLKAGGWPTLSITSTRGLARRVAHPSLRGADHSTRSEIRRGVPHSSRFSMGAQSRSRRHRSSSSASNHHFFLA